MDHPDSNIDRLLNAQANVDDRLQQYNTAVTTILFTDIVSPTAYSAILHRHTDLVSKTVAEFQGSIIKIIGESVMAEFPEPAFAVQAAVQIQRHLRLLNESLDVRERPQVRIGIDAGPLRDTVNTAARITKRSGPAQILISRSVRDAILNEKDLRCTWLGRSTVKGREAAEDVFEVIWTDAATYADLRASVTAALARGELNAPGLRLEDLVQPRRQAAPVQDSARMFRSVTVGTQLGSHEIVALLGKGGMGEVYRARDTKLKREVAIKILPDQFSRDHDRVNRFQREAEVLASLNHPNIATIYDLQEANGLRYLVLELVEGETLAERVRRGPIPVPEALEVAQYVCEALEAAHEKGIVHRDLKPANAKITPEGKVKILDFGLAKAFERSTLADLSNSPTMMTAGTEGGVILGTAGYMSPEQARGRPVDKRTDIWAFGCMLYEMLTGRQAFVGETVSDAIVAILDREPDWTALPEAAPLTIRRLLQRCFEKDAKHRLHDIADARIEIHDAVRALGKSAAQTSSIPVAASTHWKTKTGLLTAAAAVIVLVLGAMAGAALWPARNTIRESALMRAMIMLPPAQMIEKGRYPPIALSPDGKLLVYTAAVDGGRTKLYLRPLNELAGRLIPATEGASTPFFSPDGRWLAFYADGQLKKVSVAGGVPLTICEAPPVWSATWGENDNIVFAASPSSGLWLISASGGEPVQITIPKPDEPHGYPQLLPGGTQVLFSVGRDNAWRLALLSLKTREWRLLGNGRVIGEGAQYLPTGHLVYTQAGGLIATPFDPSSGKLDQPPVPLPERVETSRFGGTYFAFASATGSLVYLPAGTTVADRTLLRVDRDGRVAPLLEARAAYENPVLSHDGRKLAVMITSAMGSDIWIIDLERGTRVRFTAGDRSAYPVWGPNGAKVAFQSTAPGLWNLFWKPLDGSSESEPIFRMVDSAAPPAGANLLPGTLPTLSGAGPQFPSSWAPDGSALAFHERKPNGERDIWVVSPGSDPVPFLLTPFDERLPRFSPDGKWLAYVSDEAGRSDVYVQPFPGPGPKWLVSTDGGDDPMWSRDGRELFYRRGDRMMVVAVEPKAEFSAGRPRELFELHFEAGNNGPNYDVSPDGKWFVMPRSDQGQISEELHLVLNWFGEVQAHTSRSAQ